MPDPDKFATEFRAALVREMTREAPVLVVRCINHLETRMEEMEGSPGIFGCPSEGCRTRVLLAMEQPA